MVAGEIPAGKYHKLSCARHLRDRAREGTPEFPFVFRPDLADRIVRFFAKLKHYKGEWAGEPILLEAWQRFIEGSMVGWLRISNGLRRFRTAYVEVPRKNGKSLIGGGDADYFTFFDNEQGAEGYCAATKRDQALIVFRDAKKLVQSSGLKDRISVQVSNLHSDPTSSKLEPLSADYDSMDGLNPHFVVIDEYHAHKTRDLIDVLETAMASRRQPMMLKITTAGDDLVSPWGDERDYACKILDRILDDETYFAFIAHADETDDWLDEHTWKKANPNYGVSVKADDMRALALKAKSMPSAAAAFKQKRLGLLVSSSNPCLSVDGWRKGQNPQRLSPDAWLEELAHAVCFVGIDLASKLDLCCCSLVFPPCPGRGSWRLIQHIWTPADTLADRAHRDRASYEVWRDQGWLIPTLGTQIDHQLIRPVLKEAREKYDLQHIGFDPWHADTLITELINEDGFPETQVLAVPQTYAGMSSACLKMQAEIMAGQVDAFGCPVTAWSVSNCVDQRDGKDNMMFVKKKSRGRIDPVIAATIGMALALRMPAAEPAADLTIWG